MSSVSNLSLPFCLKPNTLTSTNSSFNNELWTVKLSLISVHCPGLYALSLETNSCHFATPLLVEIATAIVPSIGLNSSLTQPET